MAYAVRCPECSAKLAFDEAPEADEAIECVRCGHMFDAGSVKPEPKKKKPRTDDDGEPRKKKKKKKDAAVPGAPKKRKVKKKKTNPMILWGMILGALFVVPSVGYVLYKLYFSTGKVGQLMAFVPPECNLLRGVDVTRMSKYPGYKDQLNAQMKGPFEECANAFAKGAGVEVEDKEKGPYIDYAMCAKDKRSGAGGVLYVFQTRIAFSAQDVFVKGLGGIEQQMDGTTYYKLPATQPGVLSNAMVYCPNDRVICLASTEENQQGMLKASMAARANPKETSILPKLGACGLKVSRGNIWTLLRAEGDLSTRIKDELGEPIKNALGTLSEKTSSSKMFGIYLYFGRSVKYGVAISCDSPESAQNLVKAMKDGPMGKQDDSEIPRELGSAFHPARATNKDFVEFLSTLEYKSMKDCAFLEARMALEKSTIMLSYFNKQEMFDKPLEGGGNLRR